jgi:putative ABC transport system permease protein
VILRGVVRPVLPAYAELSLDPAAILVTAVMALGTGLAFGGVPALSVDRLDAQGALRDDARGASEALRPRRLRGMLVASQMALCASLLAGAGLLARSVWEMATTPLGFDPTGVLTARVRLPTRDYPTLEIRARFHEQLAEHLRHIGGVDAVAIANKAPTAIRGGIRSALRVRRRTPRRSCMRACRTTTFARCGYRSARDARSTRQTGRARRPPP